MNNPDLSYRFSAIWPENCLNDRKFYHFVKKMDGQKTKYITRDIYECLLDTLYHSVRPKPRIKKTFKDDQNCTPPISPKSSSLMTNQLR